MGSNLHYSFINIPFNEEKKYQTYFPDKYGFLNGIQNLLKSVC